MLSDWSISARERKGHIHLTSKDGFWMLMLQLLYTSHLDSGDEYTYWIKIYQPNSKFEISGPRITDSSESVIIHEATGWASRSIPKLERAIFLSDKDIAKSARKNLRQEILQGSEDSKALNFVKQFINKLVEEINFASSDKEAERAEADLTTLLSKDNVYRMALDSEQLQVHADWLETFGIINSNPKSYGSSSRKSFSDDVLILKCQNLWTKYYNRPTKKNLNSVFEHLEKMKSSKSKKVLAERTRCLRVANKERLKFARSYP